MREAESRELPNERGRDRGIIVGTWGEKNKLKNIEIMKNMFFFFFSNAKNMLI